MDEKTKAGYLGDIEYFSAKLEADKNSLVFMPLASAYIKIGSYNDAVNVLLRGIDAHHELPAAKTMLAQAYVGLGQNEDAKGLLTEVRVIDPANYLAEKMLGDIYRGENDIKRALISYRNASASAPEDGDLHKLIEELMSQAGISEQELLDDRPIDMNEEEMLSNLGQELMDEVRGDLGGNGVEEVSEETVKKTVDEIVGAADSEPSLESFADEYLSSDVPDENEQEPLASVDDGIVPTDSLDAMKEAVKDEIHPLSEEQPDEPEEESLPQEDVSGMAAELSADLGLDGVVNVAGAEDGAKTEEPEEAETAHEDTPVAEDRPAGDDEPASIYEEQAAEDEIEADAGDEPVAIPSAEDIDDIFSFDEAVGDEMLADATEPLSAAPQEQAADEAEAAEPMPEEPEESQAEDAPSDEPAAAEEEPEEAAEPDTHEDEVSPEDASEESEPEQPSEETDESAEKAVEPPHAAETADEIIPNNNFGVPVIETQGYEKPDDGEEHPAEAEAEQVENTEPDEAEKEQEAVQTEQTESAAEEPETDEEIVEPEIVEPQTTGIYEQTNEPEENPAEVIIDEAPEEVEITPEDEKAVEEVRVELDNEEKLSEELSILFAIDEMEDKTAPHEDVVHVDYGSLDEETHEQVAKLENLLELIKTNAK